MRVSILPFKVIDCRTGKEYTEDAVIKDGFADGLMEMDLDGFMICEDGCLALGDECGTYNYVNTIGKYEIEIEGYVAIDEVLEIIDGLEDELYTSSESMEKAAKFTLKTMRNRVEALRG